MSWNSVPFHGGSILTTDGVQGHQFYFGVDTVMNEGILYLHITDQAHGKIVDVRITRADGRALPDWMHVVQGRTLIAEPRANEKQITIKIQALLPNGKVVEEIIQIDLNSGSIERTSAQDNSAEHADLFTSQLALEEEPAFDDETALVRALASLQLPASALIGG